MVGAPVGGMQGRVMEDSGCVELGHQAEGAWSDVHC